MNKFLLSHWNLSMGSESQVLARKLTPQSRISVGLVISDSDFNNYCCSHVQILRTLLCSIFIPYYCPQYKEPRQGRVYKVTEGGVKGLGFKSYRCFILTFRTATSSLSREVRDGGDPCSVSLSEWKKNPTVESSTWSLNKRNSAENDTKTETNKNIGH